MDQIWRRFKTADCHSHAAMKDAAGLIQFCCPWRRHGR
jgi:hypothetical protein